MPDSPVYAILGATGGIGTALSRRLSQDGARLVLGARALEPLQSLATETGAAAYQIDATRYTDVERLVAAADEHFGRLDGVVNLVGSLLLKPAHLTTEDEFAETLSQNLTTAFHTLKASVSSLQDGGSVVLMASVASEYGLANHEAIAAAKGGVASMVRAAAASYAPKGVRINAVAPGLVRTPMTARLTAREAAEQASAKMHPLGRIGEPEDIASAIAYLLGPESSWVTGQVLSVDGGFATVRPRG